MKKTRYWMFKLGSLPPVSLFIEHFFQEIEFNTEENTAVRGQRWSFQCHLYVIFMWNCTRDSHTFFFFFKQRWGFLFLSNLKQKSMDHLVCHTGNHRLYSIWKVERKGPPSASWPLDPTKLHRHPMEPVPMMFRHVFLLCGSWADHEEKLPLRCSAL